MRYRREVDGLRALAILPVLAHHAHLPFLSGGYLGVDVFFVISGYLITGIIVSDLERDQFSLARFYERRARRILPALLLVCLASCAGAWFLMMPAAVVDFSHSLLSVLIFASNIYFFQDRDYFHPDVDAYPLLHTWSLAVEEQFYLFFPLLLLLAWRLGPRGLLLLIGAGCVASLALAQVASQYAPVANFFLLPTRAWELGVGALLGLYFFHRSEAARGGRVARELLPAIGLLLLVVPMTVYDEGSGVPGLAGIIPVLGTALLIATATRHTWVGRLLATRPLVGFGLISYSLYLWHQPLYAFLRMSQLTEPSAVQFAGAMLISVLLATLSWRFLETPFRDQQRISRRQLIVSGSAASLLLAAFATGALLTRGYADRAAFDDPLLAFDARGQVGASWALADQHTPTHRPLRVAVVGNSHAKDAYNMLRLNQVTDTDDIEFVPVITNPICEARVGLTARQQQDCRYQLLEHLQPLEQWAGFVLAPQWSLRGVNSALRLRRHEATRGKAVLVLGPAPRFPGLLPLLQKSHRFGAGLSTGEELARNTEDLHQYRQKSRMLRRHLLGGGVFFIDRRALACPEQRCEFLAPSGAPLYYDDTHLTLAGAAQFGMRLAVAADYARFVDHLRHSEIRSAQE